MLDYNAFIVLGPSHIWFGLTFQKLGENSEFYKLKNKNLNGSSEKQLDQNQGVSILSFKPRFL